MPTEVRRNDDTAQVSLIAQKGGRIPAATAPSGPEQRHTHTAGSPPPKGVDARRKSRGPQARVVVCAAALVRRLLLRAFTSLPTVAQLPSRRSLIRRRLRKRQPNANEYVNYYRSLAGLPAVDRDAGLERAELLHDQYLANWAQACETVSPHQEQLHATPGCPRNPHATALRRSWKAAVE